MMHASQLPRWPRHLHAWNHYYDEVVLLSNAECLEIVSSLHAQPWGHHRFSFATLLQKDMDMDIAYHKQRWCTRCGIFFWWFA
jgi:hypothetical protein